LLIDCENTFDAKCTPNTLPVYDHDVEDDGKKVYSEENYNSKVAEGNDGLICLDKTDISPSGSTQIEPCDLARLEDDDAATSGHRLTMFHIKISTRSSHLSHLFNQGVNSIELIELEEESRAKMKALISKEEENLAAGKAIDGFDFSRRVRDSYSQKRRRKVSQLATIFQNSA